MTNVETIIEKFGGLSAFSRALGHTNPTTVQGWKKTNRIPSWRIHEVQLAAKKNGINLELDENANDA